MATRPNIVVLAGPNGAGKTTASGRILRDVLAVDVFVNADRIAHGLSAFEPDSVALEAGRIMLRRLDELAVRRISFAFETTLASRSFAPWLRQRIEQGYEVQIVYLWLPDPEMALRRVAERVRRGGHDIPVETVRRRYVRGLVNFFELYRPIATNWRVYDNSGPVPSLIAEGGIDRGDRVLDSGVWSRIQSRHDDPSA